MLKLIGKKIFTINAENFVYLNLAKTNFKMVFINVEDRETKIFSWSLTNCVYRAILKNLEF